MTPSFFSADGLVGIIFLLMLAAALVGAIVAVTAKRLVRALAGLIVCFVGVAAMYFFLNSPFVSMMQILIYVGAIAVTIAFAIMLTAPGDKEQMGSRNILYGPIGFCCAALVTFGFAALALTTNWIPFAKINDGSVQEVGRQLLTTHVMVFELVSVMLLIAILGALAITIEGRRKRWKS
ncbi:MAG TPA: NADH-quinone oxidoreductase subunit J [Desulfobulbaceae bacterium]|nr:NADH-quinone oxidoreductase subunit J [Desulfobulbaceae bacterium]